MFEWDEAKNDSNIAKHGVSFADASRIFEGWVRTSIDGRFEYGEVRMISTGRVGSVHLTVVHTQRGEMTRLISARLASGKERLRYEEAIRKSPHA